MNQWQPALRCQARLSAARATPQLWPAAQYRPARYLCLCPLGPAIGPQPAAMPQRTAAARLLLLLAASHVQLGRQVGAQYDAIRATGDKFSLGTIEVEVLHGPTTHCRVQANVEDTGETARPSTHPHPPTRCRLNEGGAWPAGSGGGLRRDVRGEREGVRLEHEAQGRLPLRPRHGRRHRLLGRRPARHVPGREAAAALPA